MSLVLAKRCKSSLLPVSMYQIHLNGLESYEIKWVHVIQINDYNYAICKDWRMRHFHNYYSILHSALMSCTC